MTATLEQQATPKQQVTPEQQATREQTGERKTAAPEQEGTVKFRLEHEHGPAPSHPELPDLMRLRDELYALGLVGVNAAGIGYGNVSLRLGRADVPFVISGTGTGGRAELGASGYCLVTVCDAAGNRVWCRGPVAASSESMTHWAIYAACAGAGCVAHVHNRRLFDVLLHQNMPATPRDAAYGTPAMAQAVQACAAAMPKGGLVVMAGHDEGVLAFGADSAAVLAVLRPWLVRCGL